jgi:carbamoyltransferase
MIETFDTKPGVRKKIPAVLHPADYTTRPQILEYADNPQFNDLISKFESLTGVPVLLNTSFNVSGEPIVNTAAEALRDFYTTGLDHLIICDYAISK